MLRLLCCNLKEAEGFYVVYPLMNTENTGASHIILRNTSVPCGQIAGDCKSKYI